MKENEVVVCPTERDSRSPKNFIYGFKFYKIILVVKKLKP